LLVFDPILAESREARGADEDDGANVYMLVAVEAVLDDHLDDHDHLDDDDHLDYDDVDVDRDADVVAVVFAVLVVLVTVVMLALAMVMVFVVPVVPASRSARGGDPGARLPSRAHCKGRGGDLLRDPKPSLARFAKGLGLLQRSPGLREISEVDPRREQLSVVQHLGQYIGASTPG
jgi:hypothetical protein